MNELQIFSFDSKEVRTVLINQEPWWVAKDVCEILGLKNVSMALFSIDDEDKGVSKVDTPTGISYIAKRFNLVQKELPIF